MWLLEYGVWCAKWDSFLRESTFKDGRKVYTRECLRRVRRSLNGLVRGQILFTFVEMQHELGGTWPSINNAVESVNARLRDMLRHYRGSLFHCVKAIFWWRYMYTEACFPQRRFCGL